MIKFDEPQIVNGTLCEGYDYEVDPDPKLKEKRIFKLNLKLYPVAEKVTLTFDCKRTNNED